MIYPDKKTFLRLSKKGNLIPVYKNINADLDTPVSAYLKVADEPYSFLLESVEGREKIARFSFLGHGPALVIKLKDKKLWILDRRGGYKPQKAVKLENCDPLKEIKKISSRFKFVNLPGLPRYCGGFVGYLGYDTIGLFEPRLYEGIRKNRDDLKLPDMAFMLCDTVTVFDHANHQMKIVVNADLSAAGTRKAKLERYDDAVKTINRIEARLNKPLKAERKATISHKRLKVASNFSRKDFKEMVLKGKERIKEGDIIQVVLSQRLNARVYEKPLHIYRKLRRVNPSPYMYYLNLKDSIIIGSSPELLVRCENGLVETRPIAGTRPRGRDAQEDSRLEKELLQDKKELAEHLMLVDLGRNDLGRVCGYGKVKVKEFMRVEKYSHVMHIVSSVAGLLSPNKDIYDTISATFPAGTVSGSPKIRAMEIINELENLRRGPYAGAVAYFSFSGNLDSCIIIRTIIIKNKTAYIQAGAGIVADSVPEREYRETLNKARALIEAINA
ncbi:MAG: anthranilate synthase component I [Candidatus Omnitrophica bacterium]|nr:anthranilate synthase component I [Candidatus Omnitrophota bacterium]